MSLKIEPTGAASLADAAARLREDLHIGGEPGVGPAGARASLETTTGDAVSFGAILANTAMAASAKSAEGNAKVLALAQGRSDDLHGTMITAKEAEISIRLVASVRDKLLDAFHELWRINV